MDSIRGSFKTRDEEQTRETDSKRLSLAKTETRK